ncbi:MAG TPA: hypothetical protein VGG95_10205 [Edaphobacter sp.]|jgi:hypothetical protein
MASFNVMLNSGPHIILLQLLIALAAATQMLGQETASPAKSFVPFVGCKSDGQVGPLDAPRGKSKRIYAPPDTARRLAYYQVESGLGVLAPRGWFCFGAYGSSGTNLYITPQPINSKLLFTSSWKGFSGHAIQFSIEYGGTSGRFGVAQTIARIFPTHSKFVSNVISEGEPKSDFPRGPYPNDKLVYKSAEIVEFETPPNSNGLGTDSFLRPSSDPIRGMRILVGTDPDLLSLSIHLSAEDKDLISIIIRQAEQQAKSHKP